MNVAERLRRVRVELDECAEQLERLASASERTITADDSLVGLVEASELTGIGRQNLRQMRVRGKLPRPMAELAAGPVWLREDIEDWAAGRNGHAA
jgi:hypothetical protein